MVSACYEATTTAENPSPAEFKLGNTIRDVDGFAHIGSVEVHEQVGTIGAGRDQLHGLQLAHPIKRVYQSSKKDVSELYSRCVLKSWTTSHAAGR